MRKTSHYRRAIHAVGQEIPLRDALGSCVERYPENGFPVFQFKNDADCIVAAHRSNGGREFLHLVTYEEGAGAAVIETLRNATVNEEPAPDEKEFIQAQLFLICSDNNVIWTAHNNPVRDRAVNVIINQLVASFGGFRESPTYLLEATLDEDRFKELMRSGIQEIDLAVGGYKETLEYVLNNGHVERAGLFSVLASLGTRNTTQEERDASDKIMTRLTLRPGRDWNDFHVKELLADMASDILEDYDDGFSIVTKNGLRITKDSMRVKDDFNVDGNRRVVDVAQIELALNSAYDQFAEMGVLER